jgi:2-iminobutanoate/2-iminopropanoate deaminase
MSTDQHLWSSAIVAAPDCLPAGPYSLAMRSGDLIFTSGQIGLDADTRALVDGGFEAQARQVFRNLRSVFEAAGLGLDHVVKANAFLTDVSDFAAFNEIYAEHFVEPYPARTTIGVASLPLGAPVEVECIARMR